MNKLFLSSAFIFVVQLVTIACPVCERNQPKVLKGIAHGSGPTSNWDYVSVWATAIIAIITLILTIKWLVKPGEKNADHIKYSILN